MVSRYLCDIFMQFINFQQFLKEVILILIFSNFMFNIKSVS